MKIFQIFAFALLAGILTFQQTAFAELVSGKVSALMGNTLVISTANPVTGDTQETLVEWDTSTEFTGVESAAQLNRGARVVVSTEQREDGKLRAVSVNVAEI